MNLYDMLKASSGLPVADTMAKLFRVPKNSGGGEVEIPNVLRTADNNILYTADGQPLQTKE